MGAHGVLGQHQIGGDLRSAESCDHARQDVPLAAGQGEDPLSTADATGGLPVAVHDDAEQPRRDPVLTGCDGPDRGEQVLEPVRLVHPAGDAGQHQRHDVLLTTLVGEEHDARRADRLPDGAGQVGAGVPDQVGVEEGDVRVDPAGRGQGPRQRGGHPTTCRSGSASRRSARLSVRVCGLPTRRMRMADTRPRCVHRRATGTSAGMKRPYVGCSSRTSTAVLGRVLDLRSPRSGDLSAREVRAAGRGAPAGPRSRPPVGARRHRPSPACWTRVRAALSSPRNAPATSTVFCPSMKRPSTSRSRGSTVAALPPRRPAGRRSQPCGGH